MRERIINQINTGQVDPMTFYEYYADNGGKLSIKDFLPLFSLFSAGASLLNLCTNMCIDYDINLLFDKNNNFVKAL